MFTGLLSARPTLRHICDQCHGPRTTQVPFSCPPMQLKGSSSAEKQFEFTHSAQNIPTVRSLKQKRAHQLTNTPSMLSARQNRLPLELFSQHLDVESLYLQMFGHFMATIQILLVSFMFVPLDPAPWYAFKRPSFWLTKQPLLMRSTLGNPIVGHH